MNLAVYTHTNLEFVGEFTSIEEMQDFMVNSSGYAKELKKDEFFLFEVEGVTGMYWRLSKDSFGSVVFHPNSNFET